MTTIFSGSYCKQCCRWLGLTILVLIFLPMEGLQLHAMLFDFEVFPMFCVVLTDTGRFFINMLPLGQAKAVWESLFWVAASDSLSNGFGLAREGAALSVLGRAPAHQRTAENKTQAVALD